MDLNELHTKLLPFCRARYRDDVVEVVDVHKMPGHAGFSFGFTVKHGEIRESWFLRLPPPNVKWVGTADVLRQVSALNALEGHPVPHCAVRWSGDDPQWFGCPYFIVPKLEGDVIRLEEDGWTTQADANTRHEMAEQAMRALAHIHEVDWHRAEYLGAPVALAEDVARWDRFVEKAADPERLELVPKIRALLLDSIPGDAAIGIFHGDFQWANVFYSFSGELLAVIDWELVGVGATLNDLGWIATFNDPDAWAEDRRPSTLMPHADELVQMYEEARGAQAGNLEWFRALAAYKFAIISGFNLMLHRRGKRPDPMWEVTKGSIEPLLERAHALLRA
ncbi:MAG: phosphotransferase family protein [Candidatus Hydrogenedentes bacterium]|nr:phosphotransferase family protein [Candidatus Hydrogenedentota bacterium]